MLAESTTSLPANTMGTVVLVVSLLLTAVWLLYLYR